MLTPVAAIVVQCKVVSEFDLLDEGDNLNQGTNIFDIGKQRIELLDLLLCSIAVGYQDLFSEYRVIFCFCPYHLSSPVNI